MKEKPLTLSIVIPAYNEENYIGACLRSIAAQTDEPNEVIVVDNNCSDNTVKIAKSFVFVRVIKEKWQHQSFAQATGFNASSSQILGRIDADSILPPDWVSKVKQAFLDKNVIAITGGASPYDMPAKLVGTAIFHGYIYLAGLIGGQRMLWGSNCALRRSSWRAINNKVLLRPDIWEDYDLSFCLKNFGRIRYVPRLVVGVSFRAMHTSFRRHVSYQFRSVRTFYFRANPFRLSLFILLWSSTFLVYPFAAVDDWLLSLRESKKSSGRR
ncbi:MAG: glycosyltransferase family A protein [Candidatus Saccharimonadales bacterium]